MSDHENDLGDIRYGFMHVGVIMQRGDPLGIGRVQVTIPGFLDQTGWAFPMGAPGGGTKSRGFFFVPKMGSEVCVFFKGGDPDSPYFIPGNWGSGEAPSDVNGANGEDVIAIETDLWKVLIDDRPASAFLRLSNKASGDMIEFDGTAATGPGITIKASAALYIQCDGQFVVDASSAVINGRKITDGIAPI
jgi:hypothetical protein